MTKKKNILVLLAFLLLISCKEESVQRALDTKTKGIIVRTSLVQSSDSTAFLNYSGTVEPFKITPLTFQTMGTVNNVYVEVGDFVKKGQLIASVDNYDMKNIYNTTLAKYNQALDAYNRLKSVYEKGSLPEIKWSEMVANMEQAKHTLDLAKNNLEKCNMLAPEEGVIGKRNIEVGQSSISMSAPIELVRIEQVHIKISVPENEIGKIKKDMYGFVKVGALNGKEYKGKVVHISPIADGISRTYTIKLLIYNANLELKPGMVCDVSMDIRTEKSLIVPYKAVSKDNEGNTFVFLVTPDNRAKKQFVVTGKYKGDGIEVIDGLDIGQRIVTDGVEKLSDNSLIVF